MVSFWSASGTVQSLGNSQVGSTGSIYSVVKMRGPDGKLQSLQNVVVAANTATEMFPGAKLDLLGFKMAGKHCVYAVVRDGDTSEDMADAGKGKVGLAVKGIALLLLTLPLLFTIVGAMLSFPLGVKFLWNSSQIPSRWAMEQELARHVASLEAASQHSQDVAPSAVSPAPSREERV